LSDANEMHVFFSPPGVQLSIPHVRYSDPLHETCIPFMMQHSPDSASDQVHRGFGQPSHIVVDLVDMRFPAIPTVL
jgi:hypothetical protein